MARKMFHILQKKNMQFQRQAFELAEHNKIHDPVRFMALSKNAYVIVEMSTGILF